MATDSDVTWSVAPTDDGNSGGGGNGEDDEWDTRILIVLVGWLGTVSNTFAMVVICSYKKLRVRQGSILIINQTTIDLLTAFLLAVYYMKDIDDPNTIPGTGFGAQLYCRFFRNGYLHWSLMFASTYNLVVITFERYIMVVHPVWHKVAFTRQKIKMLAVVPWVWAVVYMGIWNISFTTYEHGKCYSYYYNMNDATRQAQGILAFLLQFFIPSVLMICMYVRMVMVLRARARPKVGAAEVQTNTQKNMSRAQRNLLKTMIIVVTFFICLWVVNQVTWFLFNIGVDLQLKTKFHFGTVMCVYINNCINPFIYIFNYEEFQVAMRHLLRCKRTGVMPEDESVVEGTGRTTSSGDTENKTTVYKISK